jgi:hypothetical protein
LIVKSVKFEVNTIALFWAALEADLQFIMSLLAQLPTHRDLGEWKRLTARSPAIRLPHRNRLFRAGDRWFEFISLR